MSAVSLPRFGYFGGLLAVAGLPIYIHAPKFYVDSYGVSLAALGAVLFVLRLIDVVQDPLLGRLAQGTQRIRALTVGAALMLMGLSMLGLFAVMPMFSPVLWFAVMLTGLFSGFSFLTICFYAEGTRAAERLGDAGALRLAAWRETGALIGVCLAALAPTVFALGTARPFLWFACGFAGLALFGHILMRGQWQARAAAPTTSGWQVVLRDPVARRLLVVALANAAPVAVTSTLFLFYVEHVLQAEAMAGPLLLIFFVAAASSAAGWSALAQRWGAKTVLLLAMALSILAFGFVLTLGAGDVAAFAVISAVSGVALGADMTLLPAIFARRLETIARDTAEVAFGLWAFVSKLTLAMAAGILLPLLGWAGIAAGTVPEADALTLLIGVYALVPCALKLVALGILSLTPLKET